MKRKKIIIAVFLICATIFGGKSLLWAQKSNQEKVQHITERMTKKLDLSEEQKAKVYAFNLKKFETRQNFKNTKSKLSHKERKEQLKIKRNEWKNELKEILNE